MNESKKMGSNRKSNFIQTPRKNTLFFTYHNRQESFNLSQQRVRSQVGSSSDWRHPSNISSYRVYIRNKISEILHHAQAQGSISDTVDTVENELFKHAASQEQYINEITLLPRVRAELNKRRSKSQQLYNFNSCKTMYNPTVNATNRSAVAANNMHGFQNGPFNHSIVHEPVYPPHGGCASTTPVTGGERNLAASTNSTGFRFPQQSANNLAADNRYGFPNGAHTHSIVHEPVFPAHEGCASTTYTGMNELCQILAHGRGRNLPDSTGFSFPQQHADNLVADNGYDFPNGGILNHSIVHEPVLPPHEDSASTTYTGMDELSVMFTSLGGRNPAASSESIDFSFPQPDANNLEMNHNKYGNCLETVQKNEPLALHAAMGRSLQSESSNLEIPQHVLKGKSTTFHTSSSFVDQSQTCCQMSGKRTLTFPRLTTKPINGSPSGNSEAMLPPTKRLKMGSSSGINNSSSEQWTPKMFQPLAIKKIVIDLTSEDDETSEDSNPRRHDTVDSRNLETVTGLNSSMHTLRSNPIAADIEDIDGNPGVSDFILEHFKSPMHDSMRDVIMNNVVDDLVEPDFNNEMINSKGLEADHMSEESGPSDHDNVDLSIINETEIRSVSRTHTPCKDPIAADAEHIIGRTGVAECMENNVINDTVGLLTDTYGQAFESEKTQYSKDLEDVLVSDESDPMDHDSSPSSSPSETEARSSSSMDTLSEGPVTADLEDITGFNLAGVNAEKKVSEQKADVKMESKFSSVSIIESFTKNQIIQHITCLREQAFRSNRGEKKGTAAYKCQLCRMKKLSFSPVPIYCLCCSKRVRRNSNYYQKTPEESDTPQCFCTQCYNFFRGDHIKLNAVSIPKTLLCIRKNDEEIDEEWVECSKCGKWQHEICALYNKERDLDSCAEYTCPICRLKEIEEGVRVPLPKTAIFSAKDLPRTMLSDHLENRLFRRLREDWKKFEGTMDLDEVLAPENLFVKVVLSVDKDLKVRKEFLDILPEENYPTEFPYRSKVILLFQRIDEVDVCLFAMYVQEYGAECDNPNQRCVYISYLDSVNFFRPKRQTIQGEALRTFVYHEILIGYLDFCKKRGFTTCYIWSCPPKKGEDYILYCHPATQKIPKEDKLRNWYLSMLRKASDENIVVGSSNIYDQFFVLNGKCDSKVTASRLPYFDGDFWSSHAVELALNIKRESGGEYEKALSKNVSKRALKAMGHVNPSKDAAKDILVMQKLGQSMLGCKENFLVVHLQHACMHCQEVIVTGKRWFCTDCKNFQECERCHTADSHISTSGKKHKLRQVLVEEIPFDTKDNDIILDNQLFENRLNFLTFCQKNPLQFDTLRHAKYTSMMILHQLSSYAQLTVRTVCSICGEPNLFQDSSKGDICSECDKDKGAECHEHKLSQTDSTSPSVQVNEESEPKPSRREELLALIDHASQCNSSETQPCSYPHCLKIKKLIAHAINCPAHCSGGCSNCQMARIAISAHSKICRVSQCRIPCCKSLKKRNWTEMQCEPGQIDAVLESIRKAC